MKVGSLEILPAVDGAARVTPEQLLRFTGDRQDWWAGHEQFLDPDGTISLTLGGFAVRTGDRVVLVDTGAGPVRHGSYFGGELLNSLAARSLRPEEITDVVLTHLHFDHVGWATQQGEVIFPRATYRCHASDWAHFVGAPDADPAAVRKLSPIASRLEPFSGDATVAPGVTVRHAPGHTPGSAVVVVADGAARALLLGDAVHCPAELVENEWEAVVDVDPALAARTREALAREIEGGGVPVAAGHFPGLRFGRLLTGEGRRHWIYE